jgi:hypothetical protein
MSRASPHAHRDKLPTDDTELSATPARTGGTRSGRVSAFRHSEVATGAVCFCGAVDLLGAPLDVGTVG